MTRSRWLLLAGGALLGSAAAAAYAVIRRPTGRPKETVRPDALLVRAGHALFQQLQETRALDHVEGYRKSLAADLGIPFPPVELQEDPALDGAGFRVVWHGATWAEGAADAARVLVLASAASVRAKDIPAEPAKHPLTGHEVAWIAVADWERASAAKLPARPACHLVALHADAQLRAHAAEFLGAPEVQRMLDALENGTGVRRSVEDGVGAARLAQVLSGLVAEDVPVHTLKRIVDAVAKHPDDVDDVPRLVEHVRAALADLLVKRVLGAETTLKAVRLSPALTERARAALQGSVGGPRLNLDAAEVTRLEEFLDTVLRSPDGAGVALLVPADLRAAVRALLAGRFPRLPVLAQEELPKDVRVKTVSALDVPA